jgi:hypothetical protein
MEISDVVTHAVAFFGGGWVFSFFLTRHFNRRDKHDDVRIAAYRAVLVSIDLLNSAMDRLVSEYGFVHELTHEALAPTNELTKKTADLIESNRADTGSAFADAAYSVIAFWDHLVHYMWERDYDHDPIVPPIEERKASLYTAIPTSYRKKVAPGYFEEIAKR